MIDAAQKPASRSIRQTALLSLSLLFSALLCFASFHYYFVHFPIDRQHHYTSNMVEVCELCRIKLASDKPLTKARRGARRYHTDHIALHIIPEAYHEVLIETGLYTRAQCETTIPTCLMCATAVKGFFTDAERARYLNTLGSLDLAMKDIQWRK